MRRETTGQNEIQVEKGDRTLFSNYSTFIVSPVNNTSPLFSLPRLSLPPPLRLPLRRWTPPHVSEGQSVHVYSAGPGNNDVMVRTLFLASAVNQLVANVRSKPRLSLSLLVFILIPEIAILVLTLCSKSSESTSKLSNYPLISPLTIETWSSPGSLKQSAD